MIVTIGCARAHKENTESCDIISLIRANSIELKRKTKNTDLDIKTNTHTRGDQRNTCFEK